MVAFKHIPGPDNEADIFTKNLDVSTLQRHSTKSREEGIFDTLKGDQPKLEGGVGSLCDRYVLGFVILSNIYLWKCQE